MASLGVYKKVKPRLPIPAFTGDTILTFKSISNKNHRQAKKLLFAAKSLYKKDVPKEEKQKEKALNDSCEKEYLSNDKFSISEKLTDVYLESARNGEARNGCFIKCNYLEELVVQEDLSYFIMKIYPHMIFLYYKNSCRVQFFYHANIKEECDLLDSIDNEEIPACIFDQIMSCENWHLMYDYHCFLKIQKYSFEDECASPVFSGFVLLKPTTKLLIDLTNKSADTNNNNGSSQEKPKESYESKICFEISGPLYLDVHPTALELINLLKIYQSPFGFTSLKYLLAKRPVSANKQSIKVNPFKEEVLNVLAEKIPHRSSSRKEKVSQLNGCPFSYVDLKESLHSSLVNRNLEICDALYTSQTTTLVEVFKLITSRKTFTGCKKYVEDNVKYLSVFWKYGQFYAILTLEKYVYDPGEHNDFIPLMGERENLDNYILKVAEVLSCRFSKFLSIQLKNMIDNTDKHFFPYICDTKIKEVNLKGDYKPWRSSVKSHINGTKRKILAVRKDRHSIYETDSESDDEMEFLKKEDLEAERDYKVKVNCKCAQQMEKTSERVTTSDKEDETNSDVV